MTKIKKEEERVRGMSFDEFKKKIEEEEKWENEHPVLSFPGKIKDFFLYTIPGRFSDTKYEIRWAWQRVVRGFDDSMVWNHHSYHSEQTAKILRQLAEHKVGCPGELYDGKKKNDECHKWRDILVQMAEGFEAATAIDNMEFYTENKKGEYDSKASEKKRKVLENKFDKGMSLYVKYYFNLWD